MKAEALLAEALLQNLRERAKAHPERVTLFGPSLQVAAAVIAGANQVYIVHRDRAALEHLWRELVAAGLETNCLLYHGDMQQFFRDLPISPTLLCAPASYICAPAIQASLAPGTEVVVPDSEALADCTVRGLLEPLAVWGGPPGPRPTPSSACWESAPLRESGTRGSRADQGVRPTTPPSVFRATVACKGRPTEIPSEAFTEVRTLLHQRYFGGGESAGIDVAAATASIREAWLAQAGASPGWPYRDPSPAHLPETLPSGAPWPKISIVTASFNQGRFIEETILSVLNQGYPNVEHIVIDGGSTDETQEVLARYRARLAHVTCEPDRGQSHAINKGMAKATGDILTWLNSDDMLAPGALAAIALAFDTSGADMVAGICRLYSGGKAVGQHLTACENGPLPLNDILDLDGGWNAGQFFYQPEVMFKRSLWLRAGGHVDESMYFSMDYDLWARFADAGARLHVIGRPVAWFRLHEEQKTHVQEKFFAELRRARDAFLARTGRTFVPRGVPEQPRRRLRIVLLNDHGFHYGAGVAHARMAQALASAGHEIIALSLANRSEDRESVSLVTNEAMVEAILAEKPDLIVAGNIHSVRPDPEILYLLAEKAPTLCVLHDFWLLTGRCAYPGDCAKYLTGCDETCPTADEYPQLEPPAIAPAWRTKRLFLETGLPILLANSRWTAEYARRTLLTLPPDAKIPHVEPIQLSFPLDIFRPLDKQTCRSLLGLPEDQFIVLLTCAFSDRRKGADTLLAALQKLQLPDLLLLTTTPEEPNPVLAAGLKIKTTGYVSDPQRMAAVYSAADLVVGPSVEETFGQVFLEAAACGVPSVGFASSGVQEALRDNVTGRLAGGYGSAALAAAILELYRNPDLRQDLGHWGRLYVENEWSPYSAYRHFFLALHRTGLRQQLQLMNKIAFEPESVAVPACRSLSAQKEVRGEGLGNPETPIERYNLPTYRKALGPMTSIEFAAHQAGPHLLVIYYRNTHPDQEVTIEVNGSPAGKYLLPGPGYHMGHLLSCTAGLRLGSNRMSLRFTKWARPNEDIGPTAILITRFTWIPTTRPATR